jgi:hypothetical protein
VDHVVIDLHVDDPGLGFDGGDGLVEQLGSTRIMPRSRPSDFATASTVTLVSVPWTAGWMMTPRSNPRAELIRR